MPKKFVRSYTVDITIATCIDSVYAQMMFQCVQCTMMASAWRVNFEGKYTQYVCTCTSIHCVHVSLSMSVFNS